MPKVEFKIMSLEDNVRFIKEIYYSDDNILDIYKYTISLFPELSDIPKNAPKKDIDSKIEAVVTKRYNDRKEMIEDDILRYQKLWEPYNDNFFDALANYLNIKWPTNHDTIIADVGIIPVCPRYLEDFRFSIHDGMKDDLLIETCAHELCHFLWFEKWKEIYPLTKNEEFESPNIVWEYSEMVVDPILNSKIISKVLNRNTRYAYDYFYNIKDGNQMMMDKLFDIYNNDIDIEHKIIRGFEYISNLKKVSKN